MMALGPSEHRSTSEFVLKMTSPRTMVKFQNPGISNPCHFRATRTSERRQSHWFRVTVRSCEPIVCVLFGSRGDPRKRPVKSFNLSIERTRHHIFPSLRLPTHFERRILPKATFQSSNYHASYQKNFSYPPSFHGHCSECLESCDGCPSSARASSMGSAGGDVED